MGAAGYGVLGRERLSWIQVVLNRQQHQDKGGKNDLPDSHSQSCVREPTLEREREGGDEITVRTYYM